MQPTRVITFGTFDLFHYGHLRLLERAADLGDRLIVGVSSDDLSFRKKGRFPLYSQEQRVRIVRALRVVDEVFVEHSLEAKGAYLRDHRADILVMGEDWAGRFDAFSSRCRVVYLPRTPAISTTAIIEKVQP